MYIISLYAVMLLEFYHALMFLFPSPSTFCYYNLVLIEPIKTATVPPHIFIIPNKYYISYEFFLYKSSIKR